MTWTEFLAWYDEYCVLSPRTPVWMAEIAKKSTAAGTQLTPRQVLEGWFQSLEPRIAWAVAKATKQLAQAGTLAELSPDRHLAVIIEKAREIENLEIVGKARDMHWDDYHCDLCQGLGLVVIDKTYPDGKVYQSTVACVCERGNKPGFHGLRRLQRGDQLAGTNYIFEG